MICRLRITARSTASGMNPKEQLDAIFAAVAPLYKERDKTYSEIKKLLNPYGVCGLSIKELEQQEKKYVKKYFKEPDPTDPVSTDRGCQSSIPTSAQ